MRSDRTESFVRSFLLQTLFVLIFFALLSIAVNNTVELLQGRAVLVFFDWSSSPYVASDTIRIWLPDFILGWVLWGLPFLYVHHISRRDRLDCSRLPEADSRITETARQTAAAILNALPDIREEPGDEPNVITHGTSDEPIISFTSAFVRDYSDPSYVRAAILHEIEHIRNRDIESARRLRAFRRAFAVYAGVLVAYLLIVSFSYMASIQQTDVVARAAVMTLSANSGIVIVFLAFALAASSALRAREFIADASVAASPQAKRALIEILSRFPERRRRLSIISTLFDTHPLNVQRISRLRETPSAIIRSSTIAWYGATLAAVVLTMIDLLVSISVQLIGASTGQAREVYASFGPAFYFIIEILLVGCLITVSFRADGFPRRFLFTLGTLFVYAGSLMAYFVITWVMRESLNMARMVDVSRFSPVWPEYLVWSRDVLLNFPITAWLDFQISNMLRGQPFLASGTVGWVLFVVLLISAALAIQVLSLILPKFPSFSMPIPRKLLKQVFPTPGRRLVLLLLLESILVLAPISMIVPRGDRESTMVNWFDKNLRVSTVPDPEKREFVSVGYFFEEGSLEDNFYAIHTLNVLGRLQDYRSRVSPNLGGRENVWETMIRWLAYHQDNEGHFLSGYVWWPADIAIPGIANEYYVLATLADLNETHRANLQDAETSALLVLNSEDLLNVYYGLRSLQILDRLPRELSNITERVLALQLRPSNDTVQSLLNNGGVAWTNGSAAQLDSTYFAIQVLQLSGEIQFLNTTSLVTWVMRHLAIDGGFSTSFSITYNFTDSAAPFTIADKPDLKSTFYAISVLSCLNKLDLVDSDRLQDYILSRQRISGEFLDPSSPTFDTPELSYMAVSALRAFGRVDALGNRFAWSDIFTQVTQRMPPVFYMSLASIVLLDLLLLQRWKRRQSHI